MKKKSDPEILREYDFSSGIKGKYSKKFAEGTNLILLDPDMIKIFPDSNTVNETLRTLSEVMKRKRKKISA
jgi:hypothetical protein